eukprot:2084865-Pyramimonas_sp.AAC.1
MSVRRPGMLKSKAAKAAAAAAKRAENEDAFGRAHVPFGETGAATYSKLTSGSEVRGSLLHSTVESPLAPSRSPVSLGSFGLFGRILASPPAASTTPPT